MPEGPGQQVLAVDLDGTIVEVNTFPLFVRFALGALLRQRRVGPAITLAWALVRRKAVGRPHIELKTAVCRAAQEVDPDALAGWVERVVDRHGTAPVMDLVATWEGPTFLCTAAPEPYAAVFGDVLGFDHVQGTEPHGTEVVENSSHTKADRLRRSVTGPIDTAVTDDGDLDGPLLDLARTQLIVADGQVRPRAAPVSDRHRS